MDGIPREQNLQSLKKEILGYCDKKFSIFYSKLDSLESSLEFEGLEWDSEKEGNYTKFMDIAEKFGIKVLYYSDDAHVGEDNIERIDP